MLVRRAGRAWSGGHGPRKKGKSATEGVGEREAPEGYFPKQLLSIAHLGVFSNEPHAELKWPTAGDSDEEGSKEIPFLRLEPNPGNETRFSRRKTGR